MTTLDQPTIQRRFLLLRGTRWLPTGLLIPVFVLFLVGRGLTLAEVGIVTAAQGIVVLVLELPTGGLADAIGRRTVLLVANVIDLVAILLILLAGSVPWFIVAFAFQGIYRALESGPLEAWYVDGLHANDPTADVESGLSRAGVVTGVALAVGSLAGGAIVGLDPIPGIDPLALPFVISLALRIVDTIFLFRLMTEIARPSGWAPLMRSIGAVPGVMRSAIALTIGTASLALLMAAELTWGVGAYAWEALFPVRLEQTMSTAASAAALMGPAAAGAWLASAAGSAMVTRVSGALGPYRAAAAIKAVQAMTVVLMGIFAGPVGLLTAYLACFVAHGALNPVHAALIHDHATSGNRTTITSLNSMAGMGAAAIGGIVLGVIADASSVAVGMWVAAGVLVVGAPLYLTAGAMTRRPASTS